MLGEVLLYHELTNASTMHAVHLIGTPLALIDDKYAHRAWMKFDQIAALKAPVIQIMQGSVKDVDCMSMTASLKLRDRDDFVQQKYDYLVTATGLRRAWPAVPQSLKKKLYLQEAGQNINATEDAEFGVVIVGGGA